MKIRSFLWTDFHFYINLENCGRKCYITFQKALYSAIAFPVGDAVVRSVWQKAKERI